MQSRIELLYRIDIDKLFKYLFKQQDEQKYYTTLPQNDFSLFSHRRRTTKDLDAIMGLFYNLEAVDRQLGKLEAGLELRAGNRYFPNIGLCDYVEGAPLKHKKLFSGYAREWAQDNGFSGLIKLDNALAENDFFSILIMKLLIQDKKFRGLAHGEEPHFVQMYVVTEHHKDTGFLSQSPADLYAWIGEQGIKYGVDFWFDTFESHESHFFGPNRLHLLAENSRDVFGFHRYLMSDECMAKFPVLCQLIRGRERKQPKDTSALTLAIKS